MAKVRVPQADGQISIATDGNEPTTWTVTDHVVTAKNQTEADLIVGAVDGATVETAKK